MFNKKLLSIVFILIQYSSFAQDIDVPNKFIDFFGMKTELAFEIGLVQDFSSYYSADPVTDSQDEFGVTSRMRFGVGLDFHAPTSVVGFIGGIHFVNFAANYEFDNGYEDELRYAGINLPLLVKMKTGTSSSKNRLILYGGPTITLQGSSSVANPNINPFESFTTNLTTGIGVETAFAGKNDSGEEVEYGSRLSINLYIALPRDFTTAEFKQVINENVSSINSMQQLGAGHLGITARFQFGL